MVLEAVHEDIIMVLEVMKEKLLASPCLHRLEDPIFMGMAIAMAIFTLNAKLEIEKIEINGESPVSSMHVKHPKSSLNDILRC
jgi:hypothetical protein